jgi:hypothetical protein
MRAGFSCSLQIIYLYIILDADQTKRTGNDCRILVGISLRYEYSPLEGLWCSAVSNRLKIVFCGRFLISGVELSESTTGKCVLTHSPSGS